jgi:hypothetical protein
MKVRAKKKNYELNPGFHFLMVFDFYPSMLQCITRVEAVHFASTQPPPLCGSKVEATGVASTRPKSQSYNKLNAIICPKVEAMVFFIKFFKKKGLRCENAALFRDKELIL